MAFTIDRLDHLVLNVRDVVATGAWYQRVLGMKPEVFGADRRIALKFGRQKINLRPADAGTDAWMTGANEQPGAGDLCFITATEPDAVIAHLQACGLEVVAGPMEREGALGPMRSVYCRDPDGNLIEIASYPG